MTEASDFSGDDELLAQFLEYAGECMTEMRSQMDQIAENPSAGLIDTLYTGAHNLKGMSASFGFTLLTDVAAMMCLYIKKKADDSDPDVLNGQVKALEVIVAHKIVGDGGEKGAALKERLASKISDVLAAA